MDFPLKASSYPIRRVAIPSVLTYYQNRYQQSTPVGWVPSQYKCGLSRCGDLHYKDTKAVRSSYLYHGDSYTGKTTPSCWVGPVLVTGDDIPMDVSKSPKYEISQNSVTLRLGCIVHTIFIKWTVETRHGYRDTYQVLKRYVLYETQSKYPELITWIKIPYIRYIGKIDRSDALSSTSLSKSWKGGGVRVISLCIFWKEMLANVNAPAPL